jgi:hypothetical protein
VTSGCEYSLEGVQTLGIWALTDRKRSDMTKRNYGGSAKAARKLAILAITASAGVAAVPAVALAATVWVNRSAPTVPPPGTSCAKPGYNTIQAAIIGSTAKDEIRICSSTYREQLVIEKELTIKNTGGPVTVALPEPPSNSTGLCDNNLEQQDVVTVCGSKVKITGLTVQGKWPEGTCNDNLYGIFVGGGANLTLSGSQVTHAGADPINGCQGGVGVQVGGRSPSTQVATATLTNDAVSGYQKNGIDVSNAGSTAHISKATVTGAGPTKAIAQNGIEIISGAEGKIAGSTITGNECEVETVCGPESLTQNQSAGVLFIAEAKGTSVMTSNINENDLGVYHYAAIEPTTPMANVSVNKILNNRDEGVVLDQGYAVVNKNEIAGGNVGIQLIQYKGQEFGPKGKGSEDTIIHMSRWAVEGLSDNMSGDEFGKFTISKSQISHNPGATPATSVHTNNPSQLEIVLGAGNT